MVKMTLSNVIMCGTLIEKHDFRGHSSTFIEKPKSKLYNPEKNLKNSVTTPKQLQKNRETTLNRQKKSKVGQILDLNLNQFSW